MKEFKRHRIMFGVSMATIIVALLLMLYAGYLLFIDGNNIIEYHGPMKINSVNTETNSIDVSLDYCKYKSTSVTVYVSYIDGIVYSLPKKESGSLPLGCNVVHKIYDLPKAIPDGVYNLQVDTEIHINSLRTETYRWTSEKFEVKR